MAGLTIPRCERDDPFPFFYCFLHSAFLLFSLCLCVSVANCLRDRHQRRLAVGVAQGEIEFGFDITNAAL
jgi:hypothetical protein